jgi:hypothetical protein
MLAISSIKFAANRTPGSPKTAPWLCQMRSEPTVGLRRNSAVYGLNGQRPPPRQSRNHGARSTVAHGTRSQAQRRVRFRIPTSARCSFALAIRVQHGARGEDLVWGSAAPLPPCHQNETLRSRQNQRSASVNLPKHLAGAIPTFSQAGHLSRTLIGRSESDEISSQVRVLAAFWPLKSNFPMERGRL